MGIALPKTSTNLRAVIKHSIIPSFEMIYISTNKNIHKLNKRVIKLIKGKFATAALLLIRLAVFADNLFIPKTLTLLKYQLSMILLQVLAMDIIS
jgi:hypothetical protein